MTEESANVRHGDYITKSEAATLLKISERSLDRYTYITEQQKLRIEATGRRPLRKYKFGLRKTLFRLAEIQKYLEDNDGHDPASYSFQMESQRRMKFSEGDKSPQRQLRLLPEEPRHETQ